MGTNIKVHRPNVNRGKVKFSIKIQITVKVLKWSVYVPEQGAYFFREKGITNLRTYQY